LVNKFIISTFAKRTRKRVFATLEGNKS